MATNPGDKSLIEQIQEGGKNIVTTATVLVDGLVSLGVAPQVNQNLLENQRPDYSIVCQEASLEDQLEKNESDGIFIANSGASGNSVDLVYNPPSLENQLEEIYSQKQEVQNEQREKELEMSNEDEVASGSPPDPPSEAIDEEMVVNTAVTVGMGTEFESEEQAETSPESDTSEDEDSESESE